MRHLHGFEQNLGDGFARLLPLSRLGVGVIYGLIYHVRTLKLRKLYRIHITVKNVVCKVLVDTCM